MDPQEIRGSGRHGRFDDAPGQLSTIRQALEIFSRQDWQRVPAKLGASLKKNLDESLETIEGMVEIDPNAPDVAGQHFQLSRRLKLPLGVVRERPLR